MIKIALAGQPNCGKSTIFNMLSGAKQHIANYPGVTVDKKTGFYSIGDEKIELVDLPGTYSLTSFSLEERVARDFIVNEKPDLILNVLDASNLKRNLYLTFQLMDMQKPIAMVLNMADVAKRRGISIDIDKLSVALGIDIISAVGASGKGKADINELVLKVNKEKKLPNKISYAELENYIKEVEQELQKTSLKEADLSLHWIAVKLLENDTQTKEFLKNQSMYYDELSYDDLLSKVESIRDMFKASYGTSTEQFIAAKRYDYASKILQECTKLEKPKTQTLSDKFDKIILNKYLALPIMVLIMYLLYELAIVKGYELTNYTWPILASFKNFVISVLPAPDFTNVPYLTDFGIWMVNSVNALLNYIPIFLILFALIAILEDVGYMPRMAFLLDRLFRHYGLHGQSTLPMVLAGVFAGGCAVPGVMSTKGIADPRARLATILTVPLMNCLAKIPFYTLIVTAFFKEDMALVMFFISTITILFALSVAKILTMTVLKQTQTAPFIMELPPYHLPTIKGVAIRAFERVWLYIKKIMTIVAAVAVVLFVLIQFPGLDDVTKTKFDKLSLKHLETFYKATSKTEFANILDERKEASDLLNLYNEYRSKKMTIKTAEKAKKLDLEYAQKYPEIFRFIKPKTKEEKQVNRALKKLAKAQARILRQTKDIKVENSLLGMAGRALEPITQFAGFDWKINVAFLSSFAARESSVATLGAIYESGADDSISGSAEVNMEQTSGFGTLHAIAIILFMALTPPCIATMIMIKYQTNSYGWMIFAIFYPIILGLVISSLVFTAGSWARIDGITAMYITYAIAFLLALALGFLKNKPILIKDTK